MNRDIVEGSWKQFKGRLMAWWGERDDNQLRVTAGRRIVMAGRIQEDYGFTREEAERQIRVFRRHNKHFSPKSLT